MWWHDGAAHNCFDGSMQIRDGYAQSLRRLEAAMCFRQSLLLIELGGVMVAGIEEQEWVGEGNRQVRALQRSRNLEVTTTTRQK